MVVSSTTYIWLSLHKEAHIRNKQSTCKYVKAIVTPDINGSEEMLLNKKAMILIGLLPKGWLFHSSLQDFQASPNRNCSRIDAENFLPADVEQVEGEKNPEGKKDNLKEWLAQHLYSTTGSLKDLPSFEKLPQVIQEVLTQYTDVFSNKLGKGRRMRGQQVDIEVDETM